ncbi:hypothetical protein NHF46_15295 [Arthrobacter alpinus]|nr:hypothetical protein [Arthrobacter alpinus]
MNESQSYVDFGHDRLNLNGKFRQRQRYLASSLMMNAKGKKEHGIVVTATILDELATPCKTTTMATRARERSPKPWWTVWYSALNPASSCPSTVAAEIIR